MSSDIQTPVQPQTPTRDANSASQGTLGQAVICQGWLLKKRRRKMQGFARRHFVLYQTGLLSYSFEPGKPSRDQLSLPHAAISTYPNRKDIHIDSQNATFHLKCLSIQDFNKWMTAFRKFMATDDRRKSSTGTTTPRLAHLGKSAAVVDEMGETIKELDAALTSMLTDAETNSTRKASLSKKSDKEKKSSEKDQNGHGEKDRAIFGLFKRSASHNESNPSDPPLDLTHTSPRHRAQTALAALKIQHESLIKSLHTLSYIDHLSNSASARGSPLPVTAEEHEGSDGGHSFNRFSAPFTRGPTRTASIFSDGTSDWFDAPDGGEEFFLEADERMPEEDDSRGEDEALAVNGSRSSLGGSSDDDEEEEQDTLAEEPTIEDVAPKIVVRRTELPCGTVGDEGSLFAVLKKNIGKDLSSIAFPVSFNEPITLLQNACEQLEYFDLLNKAADSKDSIERMCYVGAFAVSGYASTRHRSGRKSFNPMLAETFEDTRMKFVAEKVRHHPFEMAYHAEGEGWEMWSTSSGKTKFWGKSLEIIPLGTTHLKIGEDHYSWNKPSSFMRNLMMGTKYLEHQGKMTIENRTTKARCVIEFKQNGYWGNNNQIGGTVYSPSGEVETTLEGKWDETVAQKTDSSHLHVLWKVNPFPRAPEEAYGFTSFAITLNEITADIEGKLPPTDSRFRPDVKALERGDIDQAEAEKVRIEELQRERRRKGEDREPQWFKKDGDEWVYKGGYWEAKAKEWKDAKVDALW